ncbi:MAG: hypothetical protein ACLUCE_07860 [Streptococcus sp.]|uniref:hypothetical protein n=1 Tax=Streptococcus sp. TaxID=1306 RepID=UPI0039956C57
MLLSQRTTNDADGNFKFVQLITQTKLVKLSQPLSTRRVKKVLTTYTVTEVKGTDSTVTYDPMAAVVTVKVQSRWYCQST